MRRADARLHEQRDELGPEEVQIRADTREDRAGSVVETFFQVGKDIGATFDHADIESLLDTCPAFHETPGGVKPATKAQMFTIAADAPVSLFHEGSYDDAKFQKVKK